MISWGISCGSHDAALAVFDHSRSSPLVFASHSERFSKKKDDGYLCSELVEHARKHYGDPDRVYYYEQPWKKRLRYLRSGQWQHLFERSPRGVLGSMGISAPVICTDHHLSHAAAGYYTSGLNSAVVVVVDAIGELTTLSVWNGVGSTLRPIYKQGYPHSIGLFYSAMTHAAGLKPNGEEYIFMGMAAYGNADPMSELLLDRFVDLDDTELLVRLRTNLHRGANFTTSTQAEAYDLAAAAQQVYERTLRKVLDWAWENSGSANLVLMGGCALNCVANAKIRNWRPWKNVWIMPNPGDAGSSVGAVLAHWQRHITWPGPYLGYDIKGSYPSASAVEVLLSQGIVAIANGRAEFGPRALGNRSILADPRIDGIKDRMNWLKQRELFRPFAAVIPEHLAGDYFIMDGFASSPYMQNVFVAKDPSLYPGVCHVDGTCRIQTVSSSQHAGLYDLLMRWYRATGCPMLINTSLNIKNQPLVNDEHDAKVFREKYGTTVLTAENDNK